MQSRPRFTELFDLDLSNSIQGDVVPTPQVVHAMEPVSRDAVYQSSCRPMTIIAGEIIIQGEQILPPDDIVRCGKVKGRVVDQSDYPSQYFDEPLSPLESRSSSLETVNIPYVTTTLDKNKDRQTLHDELSRFSLGSYRSSFDQAAYEDQDEHEDDDLDITAELQSGADNNNDECRCRLNSYEEVLTCCNKLADEAAAARANSTPNIAGPSQAHIPRARETTDARPIKPVPDLRYEDVEMDNIDIDKSRDISDTRLTPSVTKARGCWQAFVHAMTGMSRSYEEECFPETNEPTQYWTAFVERIAPARLVDEISKSYTGGYTSQNDGFSRQWRSACYKISQLLDTVNEAWLDAVVPKRYQPGVHEMA